MPLWSHSPPCGLPRRLGTRVPGPPSEDPAPAAAFSHSFLYRPFPCSCRCVHQPVLLSLLCPALCQPSSLNSSSFTHERAIHLRPGPSLMPEQSFRWLASPAPSQRPPARMKKHCRWGCPPGAPASDGPGQFHSLCPPGQTECSLVSGRHVRSPRAWVRKGFHGPGFNGMGPEKEGRKERTLGHAGYRQNGRSDPKVAAPRPPA